jgi:hypothetical protein
MERERAGAAATSAPVVRWLTVTLLYVASIAHVPVVPEHLAEAPYMGFLFIAFALVAFGLAVALVYRPSAALNLVAGVLCAAGVCAYVATRLVAFPLLADDVGDWTEPLGLVCIVAETAVVVLVAVSRLWRPGNAVGGRRR